MSSKISLLTKNAVAIEIIAKDFIFTDVGQKIKTVSQFESMIDVARGTIQNSIKVLTQSGAVVLESRGQLGTFIRKKNLKTLLEFAGISFLIGVMPLPYSRLYEGLSTGLLFAMENNLNIPVNMAYMRGAQRRIQMILNQRYDFAIVSKFAALKYIQENNTIEIIKEFGVSSYLSNHVIMFSDSGSSAITDGMRIGIDYDSIDQASLTKKACEGKDVTFIQVSYTQLLNKLKSGDIDATVWNGDEIDASIRNIHTIGLSLENDDNTIAVVVIDSNRQELKKLINDLLNIDEVIHIQKQVVDGDIIPSY
ncbi:hypothetical protein G7062_08830 [Erysipelothrix sp. HDW6C]|uniref:GntR family transcriptional regulator YhfZ n=1 Tax=Erysipelothrix sp. HDW6C TaxID=2714930 RepID=UPI00140C5506|nr:GntR family transcriptional regulator YhfZ [Erysipelothrix sp. HDW6C]QIK70396.1 hypothetical protein G7062_08830 [Erysipelothrix sp. HDW6C]